MGRPCSDLSNFKCDTMKVIKKVGATPQGKIKWLCLCDCGKKYEATGTHIKQGRSTHCGCLTQVKRKESWKTHRMTGTKEHRAWCSMRSRCYSELDKDFFRYGGRGIKVCDKWINSFETFFLDMGFAPTKHHSLDRIDVNGNYDPTNCRWATYKEQASNKRNNVYIDKETRKTLFDRFGKSAIYQRALWRIKNKGMGIADAVFQPAGAVYASLV